MSVPYKKIVSAGIPVVLADDIGGVKWHAVSPHILILHPVGPAVFKIQRPGIQCILPVVIVIQIADRRAQRHLRHLCRRRRGRLRAYHGKGKRSLLEPLIRHDPSLRVRIIFQPQLQRTRSGQNVVILVGKSIKAVQKTLAENRQRTDGLAIFEKAVRNAEAAGIIIKRLAVIRMIPALQPDISRQRQHLFLIGFRGRKGGPCGNGQQA